MKQSVLSSIVSILSNDTNESTMSIDEVLTAVNEELKKMQDTENERKTKRKSDRAAMLQTITPKIMAVIGNTPLTAAEIFSAGDWDEGFTVQKLTYLLNNDLAEQVEVIDNGRNAKTYKKV